MGLWERQGGSVGFLVEPAARKSSSGFFATVPRLEGLKVLRSQEKGVGGENRRVLVGVCWVASAIR